MSKDKKEKIVKIVKIVKKKSNSLKAIKDVFKKKEKCDHSDFWTIYKILNFHRNSMKGKCPKCDSKIKIEYLKHDVMKGNMLVRAFSCILWMSPAFLIIVLASIFSVTYGPFVYLGAILLVIIFHFWALYYIIKGGLIDIKTK